MPTLTNGYKSGNQLSARSVFIWRIVQTAVWLVGITIFISLIFFPDLGVLLFWNILIPVAPALIVVAVGIWRNVCPLASVTLLPRHLGLSKKKKMSLTQHAQLSLVSVIALYLIVPLRHAVFNTSGHATAILLTIAALTGLIMGFFYDWKSAWCSSLCPVHPVEKLYGGNVVFSMPNAHCEQCVNCVIPCPDSTPNNHPKASQKTIYHKISGFLIIGGLPGFIWGWFHVPDESGVNTIAGIPDVYKMPIAGLAASLILYIVLTNLLNKKYDRTLTAVFAASGVSCYYWYRIPSLLGFGLFNRDGLLINLSNIIPAWSIPVITIITTLFFFWWIIGRNNHRSSWVIRPEFAEKENVNTQKTFAESIA